MRAVTAPFDILWQKEPDDVADALAVMRYQRLRHHAPLHYAVMMVLVTAAMFIGSSAVPAAVRYGIPLTIIGMSAWRLVYWAFRSPAELAPDAARRVVRFATGYATTVAVICSCWAVGSWASLDSSVGVYYALMMVVGTVATVVFVAAIRAAAYATLLTGMTPVTMMLVNGDRSDMAAATVIFAAAAYLARMVFQQHEQMVQLLRLQQQMHGLAYTDPLTGIANRRALVEALDEGTSANAGSQKLAIALVDLNGFKPINDNYGHAMGDSVLQQVAQRLKAGCEHGARAYRLGGDEFAILFTGDSSTDARNHMDRMLTALIPPFEAGAHSVRIGACLGIAQFPGDGVTGADLIAAADRALYRAKAMTNGEIMTSRLSRSGRRA